MSASSEAPPPIDSSDSGTNTSASVSNVLMSSGTGAAPRQQGEPNADRRQAEDDRYHRPAQHADAEHGRQGNRQRADFRPPPPQQGEAGGEGQTDCGRRDAVENRVQSGTPPD